MKSKIIILCGKSGSGKDAVFKLLVEAGMAEPIISTTSRPIRQKEKEGREYHFITKEAFLKMANEGKFLEYRSYDTDVDGKKDVWYYGSEIVDLAASTRHYIVILDIEGASTYIKHYGKENCIIIQLSVDDNIRKKRAMKRGSFDKTEWYRRLADDAVKFSDEATTGIVDVTFDNNCDIDTAVEKITSYINERTNE